ncbi:MBL fold metallo-hydrolase [Confluentibacter sediminis]|uniref:MBL fold metallo-hydrolase n=1 Tax=Confluentibacter sediminis TaxID=2219045 RepID=UPI000DABE5DF|nr:MBL fold metallo-hydrolase [Confluentibacter sediminis]
MANYLEAYFTFHKAGQGAFYGGRIFNYKDHKAWTVVYDCGTKGSSDVLNNEISNFKRRNVYIKNDDNVIDVLFISHLDYDHVSGVKRLLKEFQVKRIVIPYVPEHIRQLSLLSIIEFMNSITVEDMSFEDYARFVENPYDYLSRFAEGTEVFVVMPDNEPNDNVEYRNSNDDEPDGLYPSGTIIDDNNNPDIPSRRLIRVCKNNLQFFISTQWEFTIYLKDIRSQDFHALKLCLHALLGNHSNRDLSFDDIKMIISNHRAEAKTCYNKHLGDINAYGLIVVHGPKNFKFLSYNFSIDDDLMPWNPQMGYHGLGSHFHHSQFLGTLLMGDTSLNRKYNPVKFPEAFLEKLKFTNMFQVPHHGALKNWDLKAYNNLKLGEYYNEIGMNVCNFGYGNTYGHPSPKVLEDLNASLILNSQFLSVTCSYHVDY